MNRRPNKKDKRYNNVNNIVDMAKYKKKKIVSEEVKTFIKKDIVKDTDPLRDQIKALKERGFDNNRIAATLMIHKHIVDEYTK